MECAEYCLQYAKFLLKVSMITCQELMKTMGIACSGCICCCAPKGSGGFVRHSPDGCECKKEIVTSDVSLSSACLTHILSCRPQVLC